MPRRWRAFTDYRDRRALSGPSQEGGTTFGRPTQRGNVPLFYTVAEVVFLMRLGPEVIRRLIRDGQLRVVCRRVWRSPPGTPGRYPQRRYYIPEEDILRLRQEMLDGSYRPAPRSVKVSEGRRRLVNPDLSPYVESTRGGTAGPLPTTPLPPFEVSQGPSSAD
mgnify:CR=1 FL=1